MEFQNEIEKIYAKVKKMPVQNQTLIYYPHVVNEVTKIMATAHAEGKTSIEIEDILSIMKKHSK